MWRSVTSSDPRGASSGTRDRRGRVPVAAVAVLAVLATPVPSPAQVLLTQDEALRLAFPEPARIERRTAYLDESQLARIEDEKDVEFESTVVTYYLGRSADGALGAAYFDVHRVRTRAEVLMIVVDPAGRVDRIEVLRFAEPPEYRAPDGWLERFEGRRLTDDLDRKNAVAGITGATLTSRVVTEAVRRTLALHAFIDPLADS